MLPGTYGDQAGPAGATPWGQPWGPESQQAQNAGPMPSYEWGGPQQQPGPAPLPDGPGALPPQQQGHHIPQQPGAGSYQVPQQPQAYQLDQPQHAQPLPQAPHGQQPQPQPLPQAQHGQHGQQPQAYPLDQHRQGQPLPPHAQGAPLPPAVAAGAGYDGDATQYIPPVAAQQQGAAPLPPEQPAADATQFLGRAVGQPMPGALPDAVPGGMPAGTADSEATQYIPPVPAESQDQGYGVRPGAPGDRRPPAEFDALFRTQPEGAAASTQQMPRFDPHAQQNPPQQPGVPQYEETYEPEPSRRKARTGSKVPLIAAVGVGLLVVGIGAGALLGGGSDDDTKADKTKTVSDSSSAPAEPSASADPAREQAVALDKLLADSNNSRESVVRAVANIGACKALPQSSKDLRSAATQRNALVTRLNGLSVDKLPQNAALKSALTSAWKASASADSHYAAWGDQAAGKNVCKKGRARATSQRHAGDRASGTASTQKAQASKLWNAIAGKYGLTQRSAIQL
nr:hypothetical protein [Streptomyces sp. SID5785]